MAKTFIIADNQDITKAGLRHFIGTAHSDSVVFEAEDKKRLTELLLHESDAIVILDYTNTGFNSTDEILNLSKKFTEVKWILFSTELGEPTIKEMSLYENISMILKESSTNEILAAMQYAIRGEKYLCQHISNMLISGNQKKEVIQQLTQTEIEVLKLIAHGKTVKEIATLRNSSFHTIVTHKKNIFRKLEVNTVYEATKYALKAGLIEIVEYYI